MVQKQCWVRSGLQLLSVTCAKVMEGDSCVAFAMFEALFVELHTDIHCMWKRCSIHFHAEGAVPSLPFVYFLRSPFSRSHPSSWTSEKKVIFRMFCAAMQSVYRDQYRSGKPSNMTVVAVDGREFKTHSFTIENRLGSLWHANAGANKDVRRIELTESSDVVERVRQPDQY